MTKTLVGYRQPTGVAPFGTAFDRFFGDAFSWPSLVANTMFGDSANATTGPYTSLSWNLYQKDDCYIMQVLLPGVNLETLQISAQQNVVQLQGVAGVAAPEGAHGLWASLGGGEFSEQFTLPTEVDAEKATADYAHGILTIMLPKAEHTRARKIAISTSQNQQPLIESQAT